LTFKKTGACFELNGAFKKLRWQRVSSNEFIGDIGDEQSI